MKKKSFKKLSDAEKAAYKRAEFIALVMRAVKKREELKNAKKTTAQ